MFNLLLLFALVKAWILLLGRISDGLGDRETTAAGLQSWLWVNGRDEESISISMADDKDDLLGDGVRSR